MVPADATPTPPPPAAPPPQTQMPPRPVPVAGPRLPVFALLLVLVLVAAAGAGAVVLLRPPHLEFTNALAGPVRLVVGDEPARTVAPGASLRVAVPKEQTVVAQWELVRPMSADGQPMGEAVHGSSVVPGPSRTPRVVARPRTADDAWFAPLITNASSHPLRVRVNARLRGAVDCGCAVRAGTRRVFIGYYRLFQNSTVGAWAPDAGAATFRDLGPQVTASDGSVGLRFEDKDLR